MNEQKFKEHKIHQTLTELISFVGDIKVDNADPTFPTIIGEIKQGLSYIQSTLKAVDATIGQISKLDNMLPYLDSIKSEINNYASNLNVFHLTSGRANLDPLIEIVNQLPIIKSSIQIDVLQTRNLEIAKKFDELIAKSQAQVSTLENRVGQIVGQEQELKNSITEIKNNLEQQKTAIGQLTTAFQTQFSEEQSKRISEFNTWKDTLKSDFDSKFKNLSDSFDQRISEFNNAYQTQSDRIKNETAANIEEIKKQLIEARKIVKLIGDTAITGGYQANADKEAITANNYRKWALGLMLLGVSPIVIPVLVQVWQGDFHFDYLNMLYKALGALPIFIPAFYCANESAKHRKISFDNRLYELQLVSLEPYLQGVEEEERKRIRGELTKHFFSKPAEESEGNDNDFKSKIADFIKILIDKFKSE